MFSLVVTVLVILNSRKLEASACLDVYPNVTKAESTNSTFPLYFGLMLSQGGDQQSTGALNGVKAALDEINSNDILPPGYSLHYTLTNSEVKFHNAVHIAGYVQSTIITTV